MKLKRFLNASMILAFLAMSQTALAQAFTVQGRVVDESGEPMIGVAVTNKDGTRSALQTQTADIQLN